MPILSALLVSLLAPASDLRAHVAADAALAAGRAAEARAAFARCLEGSPEDPTLAYGIACAAALEGDRLAALAWLEQAERWGYAEAELAAWDEDLASLRDEERFASALGRMRERAGPPSLAPPGLTAIRDLLLESRPVAVAIDDEARFVAAAESGGAIQVLDARTGRELRRSERLGAPLVALSFRPGGERVAALGRGGDVFLWSAGGGDVTRVELEDGGAWRGGSVLAHDPTGARLLASGPETVLWTAEGELLRRWDAPLAERAATQLAWSPDGRRFAAATAQGVRFFDAERGEERESPLACPSPPRALHFAADGRRLATGHEDLRARVWDLETRELLATSEAIERVLFEKAVDAVRFSPDGARVALACSPKLFAAMDAATGEWFRESARIDLAELPLPRWSPDGSRLWLGRRRVFELDLARSREPRCVAWGGTPAVSRGGLAVFTTDFGVAALDGATGRILWHRVALDGERELIQTAEGYFTLEGASDDLAGLELARPDGSRTYVALHRYARRLLDPKRVRAARAGVALAPLDLGLDERRR